MALRDIARALREQQVALDEEIAHMHTRIADAAKAGDGLKRTNLVASATQLGTLRDTLDDLVAKMNRIASQPQKA